MMFQLMLKFAVLLFPFFAWSAGNSINVPVHFTTPDGSANDIGFIRFTDTKYGLVIEPHLTLAQGRYGLHIHENPSCAEHGNAAGGHLDPEQTKKHEGPYGDGHLGDLPLLIVDGEIPMPSSLAPRLSVEKILNHSVMIHAHGDNYSDNPSPLGGGGPRKACGVIASS